MTHYYHIEPNQLSSPPYQTDLVWYFSNSLQTSVTPQRCFEYLSFDMLIDPHAIFIFQLATLDTRK